MLVHTLAALLAAPTACTHDTGFSFDTVGFAASSALAKPPGTVPDKQDLGHHGNDGKEVARCLYVRVGAWCVLSARPLRGSNFQVGGGGGELL